MLEKSNLIFKLVWKGLNIMRTLRLGMIGSDVLEIQALLKKLGYDKVIVCGLYSDITEEAVKQFQKDHNLPADGIIGPKTYAVMEKYLLGYTTYRIKSGDNLYRLARRFYSSVEQIETANPELRPLRLQPGEEIIIPFRFNVVDTNINYTYDIMERDLIGLQARYPFLEIGFVGRSVLNRKLYYIRLGRGPNEVFYNAAHHALEWITAPVLMKFIEDFARAYAFGGLLGGYDPRDVWRKSSVYLIPMVNPDGVDLVLNGLSQENPYYYDLISWNQGRTDFSTVWQANIHGVDLNHNYDAAWNESVTAAAELGITGPGPRRYPGPYPESEPESHAVANFTRIHDFRLAMAYHSQGQVIFWNFLNLAHEDARTIGEALARDSGYKLEEAQGIASTGGYKDWFVKETGRPGYTVEVGKGENPLPISQFDTIYADNVKMLMHAAII